MWAAEKNQPASVAASPIARCAVPWGLYAAGMVWRHTCDTVSQPTSVVMGRDMGGTVVTGQYSSHGAVL